MLLHSLDLGHVARTLAGAPQVVPGFALAVQVDKYTFTSASSVPPGRHPCGWRAAYRGLAANSLRGS